jgi:hypothetical protein
MLVSCVRLNGLKDTANYSDYALVYKYAINIRQNLFHCITKLIYYIYFLLQMTWTL